MNLTAELILSFYEEIADIGKAENIKLVKHIETGVLYVKKTLSVYDADLYKILKELKIDGVPEIFHIIERGNELTVIEEYINGRTLQDIIDTTGPMEESKALHVILSLCTILHQLHSLDTPIIHRDIKPSNVVLSSHGDITLIDFNVSRKFDANKKQDTIFMGTVDYAAPEQYGFGQSDARTDIYALGQLLNVLLTGFLPKEHLYMGKPEKVINKCTHLDPNKRYRSVLQLSNALARIDNSGFEPSNKAKCFIPPGFRSKKPWKMIVASFGYFFLLYFIITMEVTDMSSVAELYFFKLFLLLCVLAVIAFSTNYLDIRHRLPFGKNRYLLVRILSAVCWLILFMLAAGIITAFLSAMF